MCYNVVYSHYTISFFLSKKGQSQSASQHQRRTIRQRLDTSVPLELIKEDDDSSNVHYKFFKNQSYIGLA